MATTQNTFTGNGSNLGPFSFTFKWLEPTDIKVTVAGVLKTVGTHYNLQSLNYSTKTGGQVLFTAGNAPANGAAIVIYRQTDDTDLAATFSSGSAIRAQDLNSNFTQGLYVAQEVNNSVVTANTTANTALTNSNTAISTANTASTNASAAVATANTASANASAAVSTANTASANATTAVNTANSAAAAVANVVTYTIIANVAAIPATPANNTAVEITNSTGIQSFTPLSGVPVGFVGSAGLSVRIIYSTVGSTWNWVQYFPNDPEARYLKLAGGNITGNLGINNPTPAYALDVASSVTQVGAATDAFIQYKSTAGNWHVGAMNSNAYVFYSGTYGSGTERARIDSSGRLGLGGITPAVTLDVANIHGINNSITRPFRIRNYGQVSATGYGVGMSFFYPNGTTSDLGFEAAAIDSSYTSGGNFGNLIFSTNNNTGVVERMRISSDGGTLWRSVGATSTHDIGNNNTSFTGYATTISTYRNTVNNSYSFIGCVRQGFAVAFEVRDSGNVYNTNGVYGAFSDIKLKENIVDAASQWNDIKALQVRKYNFKEETGQPTHTQIGLVAQEAETVSPGLVSESPDRDAEGNDLGTVTKSVNYSVLYMKAVKALQEAMERIETLEVKVAALEAS